jgi:pimeloyl-ACP methyl ester carboxylesterase
LKQRIHLALALALSVVVAGCSPIYKGLPTLDDVPELRTLAERSDKRQIRLWKLPVGEIDGAPYSIVAEETGTERTDVLIVPVHGLVSDRTTWRFLSGHLGESHRLWIPDQLGCGESDRPNPTTIGESAYSPSASAKHLLEALVQRNDEAGWPDRIFFVGHSLGGAVVLRILGSPELHADYPRIFERVDSALLIAPLEFAVHRSSDTLAEMSKAGGFKFGIGKTTGLLREMVARELVYLAENPDWVLKLDIDRVLNAFDGKQARRSTQAIIRQAVPFDPSTERPDWDGIDPLVADYANVHIPVLLLWGRHDETLPLSMGYKLLAELPDARLRIVDQGKHSLQADRPQLVSDWIRRFVDDPGTGWAPIETID